MTVSLGIDVGGTSTDAVLLRGTEVLAWTKERTTGDVHTGVLAALRAVLGKSDPVEVHRVCLGTTHFTNAVLERRHLARTAVVRLCLPAGTGIPPFTDWPEDLKKLVDGGSHLLPGGLEHDGRAISELRRGDFEEVLDEIGEVCSLVVCGVFSNIDPRQEEQAAAWLEEMAPAAVVTRSHLIGRTGLLERENAAILNAALVPLARTALGRLERALREGGLSCPLFISRNNGSLMSCREAMDFPVQTFASGPTNSIRGAALLAGVEDGLVVDVGGTSTDVGLLTGGYPRPASFAVRLAGVRTNFQLPDLVSIPLGGGSVVSEDGRKVGPDSVGYDLTARALVFGGDVLTATDVAVASGLTQLGHARRLDPAVVQTALDTAQLEIRRALERTRLNPDPVAIVAVGGAAFLVPEDLPGVSCVHRPRHGPVANAIGAALGKVVGEVDQVVDLDRESREEALQRIVLLARRRAVAAGGEPSSLRTLEVEEVPLAYLKGNSSRLIVRVEGQLP